MACQGKGSTRTVHWPVRSTNLPPSLHPTMRYVSLYTSKNLTFLCCRASARYLRSIALQDRHHGAKNFTTTSSLSFANARRYWAFELNRCRTDGRRIWRREGTRGMMIDDRRRAAKSLRRAQSRQPNVSSPRCCPQSDSVRRLQGCSMTAVRLVDFCSQSNKRMDRFSPLRP